MPKHSPPADLCGYRFKRIVDLVLGSTILLALSPFLLLIVILILLTMGAPVSFRQIRPGLHGRPFTLNKFRTMTDERDEAGNFLPDGQRLTRLGRFLRSTSLDEFPELFNVLKGDMSLVGPRPLLLEYLPYYTPSENRRHDVRPGITGWAQIHGRNYLPWKERLAHDVWYVDHQSLLLDLRILWKTFWLVIRREGVAANSASVETNLRAERSGSSERTSTVDSTRRTYGPLAMKQEHLKNSP